MDAATEEIHCC